MKYLLGLSFIFFSIMSFAQDLRPVPCYAKTMYDDLPYPMPPDMEIIEIDGHVFRLKDTCMPVYVTYEWKNNHIRKGLEYSTNFIHTFGGEIWYRDDVQDFIIAANPNGIKFIDKVTEENGKGFRCLNSSCSRVEHYTSAKLSERMFLEVSFTHQVLYGEWKQIIMERLFLKL
jgi:hypothetical protein